MRDNSSFSPVPRLPELIVMDTILRVWYSFILYVDKLVASLRLRTVVVVVRVLDHPLRS